MLAWIAHWTHAYNGTNVRMLETRRGGYRRGGALGSFAMDAPRSTTRRALQDLQVVAEQID